MSRLPLISTLTALLASHAWAQNFTIAGGQIFTPGIAVLNAPQPGTPLGGETLHISLDVTANGRLPLPPYAASSPTQIHNITIFLYSRDTGLNLTVNNGTADVPGSERLLMSQQPTSTVKHVNWPWPACLVGDGQPRDPASPRGGYNISIRQNFRLNGRDHYTVFDVPISIANRIDEGLLRPSCDSLNNPLLSEEEIDAAAADAIGVLFAPGDATQIQFVPDDDEADGLGPQRSGLGLGGARRLSWSGGAIWLCGVGAVFSLFL